jgi:hypothetical protein
MFTKIVSLNGSVEVSGSEDKNKSKKFSEKESRVKYVK